jgi:hypothetical protein
LPLQSDAAVRLADETMLAGHAAAIRAASLITDEPASMLSLRTGGTAARPGGIASDRTRQRPSSSDRRCTEMVVTCRRRPNRGAEPAE